MRFFVICLAVVVSLSAYRSIFVHHANSATSNARGKTISKPVLLNVVLTAYVPEPKSITKSGIDANSRSGAASHWGVLPKGTKITIIQKVGGLKKIGPFLVDDRIPVSKSEQERYAITANDLREGKQIHIDLRILPQYLKGRYSPRAFNDAVVLANKIGRRRVDVEVVLPTAHG